MLLGMETDDAQTLLDAKIASILLPHIHELRNKARAAQPNPLAIRFVHYTTAENALKIIQSRRVWMRNITCMSDFRETKHGFDALDGFLAKDGNQKALIESLDCCAEGVCTAALNYFESRRKLIQEDSFITCLSEHLPEEDTHGRLSMWRAFGGNSGRVGLVFELPWVRQEGARALGLTFSPVAYLGKNRAHAIFEQTLGNIRRECEVLRSLDRHSLFNWVLNMLLQNVLCMKHEGFSEEREWRVLYLPYLNPSKLMELSLEAVSGVPQPIFKIPMDVSKAAVLANLDFAQIFQRLIIGPTQFGEAMERAFMLALNNAGVKDPDKRVVRSGIPIRS